MTTVLSTIPNTVVMSIAETLPWGVDCSALLGSGEVIESLTVTLSSLFDGSSVTLIDAPTINGNVVVQIVRGSELVAGQVYRMRVLFNASPAVNEWAADLLIQTVA